MRQIVLEAPGKFVERQAQKPSAGPGEALVRIRRVGLCGTDFSAFVGRHPICTYPRVLGHELAGEIVEIGNNDHGLRAGDTCAIDPYLYCGSCPACRRGKTNCCEHVQVYGVHVDGGMQGYLPVRLDHLYKSDSLSADQLALIETLGIGAHAVDRSGLTKNETALVIGAGPIGLGIIGFARLTGASVSVVESNPHRRRFAEMAGVEARAELDNQIADAVFDATGSSASMSKSVEHVATMGRLVFVGLTKEPVKLNDGAFHQREITIYASRNSVGQFPRIIRLMEERKIDTCAWISDRMALKEVPSRLMCLPGKSTLVKAMVELDDSDI
jgi:2-desacetyl-2-hydroxyethyl bacteriochlorophyllide A dehydrogenase